MDYFLLQGKEADLVRNYMPEEVFQGFSGSNSRYALCAAENDKLIGAGVFDAFPAAHILSIRVVEEYRGDTDSELLSNILNICQNLGCEGAYFEIYDEDDHEFWNPIMDVNGFIRQQENDLYRIPISDMIDNDLLDKVHVSDHIVSLGEVSPIALRAYGNQLTKSESFDNLLSGSFSDDLSSLYVNQGVIEACLLISDQGPTEGFSAEYANTAFCKNKTALMQLFKYSSARIMDYYKDESLSGYALATNNLIGQIIQKVFPNSEIVDHCSVFVITLDNTGNVSL